MYETHLRQDHQEKTARGWGYAVFGRVVAGMEVVEQIRGVPTGARGPMRKDAPLTAIVIQKAERLDTSTEAGASTSGSAKPAKKGD